MKTKMQMAVLMWLGGLGMGWGQLAPFSFSGNGYDFVVFVAQNRQMPVAVDPDALEELSQLRIEVATGSTDSGATLLAAHLPATQFVLKPVELATGVKVTFVSTTAGWAHMEAMQLLKAGQVTAAYTKLKAVTGESALARHCAAFVKACDAIGQRNQMLNRLEPDIRQRVENFTRSLKDLELAKMAANSTAGSGSSMAGFAASRHEQALKEGRKAWENLDEFAKGLLEANQPTRECLAEARAWGLQTEARFLYEQVVDSGLRLRRLLALMKKAGLAESEEDFEAVPDFIKDLRKKYADTTAEAERRVANAAKVLATQPATAEDEYLRAYDADRACPLARVGYGHVQMRRATQALQAVFGPGSTAPARIDACEKEWSEREKRGLLFALFEYRRQAVPAKLTPRTKTGTARGLVVSDGKGELFPVAVRIENIPWDAVRKDEGSFGAACLCRRLRSSACRYPSAVTG